MLTVKNPTQRRALYIVAILGYVALICFGFYLLAISKTGASIQSPWQTINPVFIYVFFAATFLLGLLVVFSKLQSSNLLILILFHSLLLHSYLPLTHDLLYGADQWRHMAVESRIMSGLPYLSPKLSDGTTGSMLNNVIGRVSYSGMWYVSAGIGSVVKFIAHQDTTSSLMLVNKWLVPIWWSLTVPLLLFLLGRALEWDQRKSVFLSWLGFLPFAMQAPGAMTLPVSFSFPFFLAGLILLIHRLKNKQRKWLWWLLVVGILVSLNYILYAVLFWLGWTVAETILFLSSRGAQRRGDPAVFKANSNAGGLPRRPWRLLAMTIAVAFVLPVLEHIAGYSHFDSSIHWFAQIKQLIGNLTAVYIANGPRSHTIDTGNIIFNQIPSYAFVANAFTAWRWWLIGFMVLFLVLAKYGAWQFWRTKLVQNVWLLIFGFGLFASYVISRYFLVGEQVLTRRLDTTLALFFIIFVANGIWETVKKYQNSRFGPYALMSLVLVLSLATTASYSLGPNSQTVSAEEYHAVQYIWSQDINEAKHCVIADTLPLTALEAISGKEIIGGGFPIDQYFAQPEREWIFQMLSDRADDFPIKEASVTTGAEQCWLVMRQRESYKLSSATALEKHFGEIGVWRYSKK